MRTLGYETAEEANDAFSKAEATRFCDIFKYLPKKDDKKEEGWGWGSSCVAQGSFVKANGVLSCILAPARSVTSQ